MFSVPIFSACLQSRQIGIWFSVKIFVSFLFARECQTTNNWTLKTGTEINFDLRASETPSKQASPIDQSVRKTPLQQNAAHKAGPACCYTNSYPLKIINSFTKVVAY